MCKEKFVKQEDSETPLLEISNQQYRENASVDKKGNETQVTNAAVGGDDSVMQTAMTEVQNICEMKISGPARVLLDSASDTSKKIIVFLNPNGN